MRIQFCGSKGCRCPEIQVLPDNNILLGGDKEGYSTWSKLEFADFVEAAKAGKFDALITPENGIQQNT